MLYQKRLYIDNILKDRLKNNVSNNEGQHDYESFRKKKVFKDSFFELDE